MKIKNLPKAVFEEAARVLLASGDDLCIPAVFTPHWRQIASDGDFISWARQYAEVQEQWESGWVPDEDALSIGPSDGEGYYKEVARLKGDPYKAIGDFESLYRRKIGSYQPAPYAVGTTFSPSMMAGRNIYTSVIVTEVTEADFLFGLQRELKKWGIPPHSIIGHANTAEVLSRRLQCPLPFNRENFTLVEGQKLFVAVPQIRFSEAREFSDEEIQRAPFRFFIAEVPRRKRK